MKYYDLGLTGVYIIMLMYDLSIINVSRDKSLNTCALKNNCCDNLINHILYMSYKFSFKLKLTLRSFI